MKLKRIKRFILSTMSFLLISSFSLPVFAADVNMPKEITQFSGFNGKCDTNYVEITDDNISALSLDNLYNESIGMTDEDALQLFNDYLASLPNLLEDTDSNSADHLDDFADYAVEQGIIKNTATQRKAITKAVVRAQFKIVASAGSALGFKTAGALLKHSLQNNPSNLSYSSGTSYASQIARSSECKTIVRRFKSYVKTKKLSTHSTSGSTTLNSTTDLHLAYNKVRYVASGKKKNGLWILTITFSDTYDFKAQAWKNAMTNNPAVTILNNYAAYAQSLRAIVPYKIKVKVKTVFKA